VPFEGDEAWDKIHAMTLTLAEIFRPFDFGGFEFRFNAAVGEVDLLEVNLQCNLWSENVYGRSAVLLGWKQEDLIETIIAESLIRRGLMNRA
jgi:D-alanine-D-alanine ligase